MDQTVYFAKLREDAKIPTKELENAGYDVYACFDEEEIRLEPHDIKLIPTGICSAFSDDFVMTLQERGSTGTKGIAQRCGIIDSGFRGQWQIPINNTSDKIIVVTKDIEKSKEKALKEERDFMNSESTVSDEEILKWYTFYPYSKAITQALLLPVPKVEIQEITPEELQAISSKRGSGMLGSSGK